MTHEWLSGQVNHNLRLGLLHPILEGTQISQIGLAVMPDAARGLHLGELTEEIGFRFGLKGIAPHLGTESLEPEQQPTSFEAGVAG
jgi:hypothetical protein